MCAIKRPQTTCVARVGAMIQRMTKLQPGASCSVLWREPLANQIVGPHREMMRKFLRHIALNGVALKETAMQ